MNEEIEKVVKIHGLIDRQLTPDEAAEIEAILSEDPQLTCLYEEHADQKSLLSRQPKVSLPPNGWSDCVLRLNEIDRAQRTERFVTKYSWAACAVVLAALIGGAIQNRITPMQLGTGDVPRLSSNLIDGYSSGASSITNWLQQKLGVSPVRKPSFLAIQDAKSGFVDGHPEVRLTLTDPSGSVSLFIVGNYSVTQGVHPVAEGSPFSSGTVGDMNCVTWDYQGLSLIMVGPRSVPDLCNLARQITINR